MQMRAAIPNILSLGNLLLGYMAIFFTLKFSPEETFLPEKSLLLSAGCIFLALLLDGLDGPIARALKVSSKLGEQLDSLADLTTFGIAPSILIYRAFLEKASFPIGIVIGGILLYPACAALRLARFNIEHDLQKFSGLPSPVAGISMASLVFLKDQIFIPSYIPLILLILISLLMISNIQYPRLQILMKSYFSLFRLFLTILIVACLAFLFSLPLLFYGFLLLYIFSGMLSFLFHIIQKGKILLGGRK